MPTFGSLFAGIGGIDLGLERAGWTPAFHSEVDPYCARILAKHWPHVPNLGDVTLVDWEHVDAPDLIAAGFPCQPFSSAGLRRGAEDDRYLWPEVVRCLRVLRPRVVLLENVPGLVSSPEFGCVIGDLASLGYDAEWDCIPAAAVGAPHLRYRVFIVAHAAVMQRNGSHDHRGSGTQSAVTVSEPGNSGCHENVAYADAIGRDGWPRFFGPEGWGEPPNGGRWSPEPDVGRVAHGVPDRVDRLKALGNAVVPQVAEWIGSQLLAQIGAHR